VKICAIAVSSDRFNVRHLSLGRVGELPHFTAPAAASKEYLRNSITQLPKKSNVPADVSLRLKNI
jgi:hypothetical protein